MPLSRKTFRKFINDIPWAKVYNKVANTEKGQRIHPTKSNDPKSNLRIDKGAKVADDKHELVIQANKNADNAEVKKSAQKDSHRILANCTINPTTKEAEKAGEDLEKSFRENN